MERKLTNHECLHTLQVTGSIIRACLRGGGGPQVGEVTRLAI